MRKSASIKSARNKKVNSNTTAAFGLAALLVIAGAYFVFRTPPRRNHGVMIDDVSVSTKKGCECQRVTGERVLADSGFVSGSTLAYMSTGDGTTDGEPVLQEDFKVPDKKRVMEGKGAEVQRQQKILASIQKRCDNTKPTDESPIFKAIATAIAHLRTAGCSQESDCVIYVQTDGEETGDPQIKAAIDRSPRKQISLPQPIDNTGIRIVFVGLAERTVRPSPGKNKRSSQTQRSDHLQQVWKSLFTNPNRVSFEPFCSNAEASVTTTTPDARSKAR